MRLKRNAAWRQRRPAALVAAQVADLAEPPLVKPELPKAPEQPDLRGVKSEVLKAQHEKKYEAERKKWLERKKHYKEVEYPAYKAEKRRREALAAAEQLKRAPEVRQRREQRAKHAEERKLQREEERQQLLLKRRARWVLPYRKAKWAVSEERREQERHAVRCHGIIGWKQCKLLSCHPYEHARPLKDGGMFCAWHASQGEVPGWRERLADVQEEEYYAVRVCLEGRPPPSFGPSGVQ